MSNLNITTQENLRLEYELTASRYRRLGQNLKGALESFLGDEGVSFLSVNYRTKQFESFVEKAKRKKYNKPLSEMDDIGGVRIICYFQSDIERVKKILKREFKIIEEFDKRDELKPTEFGYRSSHFVIKIKKEWLHAPNYRGLEDLKLEVQVRTVLMHAWAEMEHKLAYKKQKHIPPQFRRKFSRISAKLEEADEQFQDLVKDIGKHKTILVSGAKKRRQFDKTSEMNLDSLQAFLDYHFPRDKKDIKETRNMLDEFLKLDITIRDLVESYEKVEPYLPHIAEPVMGLKNHLKQVGSLKDVLEKAKDVHQSQKKVVIQSPVIEKKEKISTS